MGAGAIHLMSSAAQGCSAFERLTDLAHPTDTNVMLFRDNDTFMIGIEEDGVICAAAATDDSVWMTDYNYCYAENRTLWWQARARRASLCTAIKDSIRRSIQMKYTIRLLCRNRGLPEMALMAAIMPGCSLL